jgi:hypothetical protein
VIPGFSAVSDAVIQAFGQPVRIRLDTSTDPVVVRETMGVCRRHTTQVTMLDRRVGPVEAFVTLADRDTVGINIERCEIDVSILEEDALGPVEIMGQRFRVVGWKTHVIVGSTGSGVVTDGLLTTYRLQTKT